MTNRNQQIKAYEMANARLVKSMKMRDDLTRKRDHYEEMPTSLAGDDSKTVGLMVRTGELPHAQEQGISKFMRGQTRPTVPGEKIQDFIYLWDYEAYLKSAGNESV